MQADPPTEPSGPIRGARSGQLRQAVLERISQAITSGRYPPETPLSESALASEFEVSRTPVREALKQLQAEGLVRVVPRVGTFVAEPSRREIIELFQVKEVLEGLAARQLALRGRVPELEQLERNVDLSERAVQAGDHEAYARLVHEFHHLIVASSDNTKLIAHNDTLMNQLAYDRLVRTTLARPDRPGHSVAEHRAILERILDKDAYGAEQAMRDHVRSSYRVLLMGLGSGDGATTAPEAPDAAEAGS
jgi:DNA-binding GntR family transcriptional regulator